MTRATTAPASVTVGAAATPGSIRPGGGSGDIARAALVLTISSMATQVNSLQIVSLLTRFATVNVSTIACESSILERPGP